MVGSIATCRQKWYWRESFRSKLAGSRKREIDTRPGLNIWNVKAYHKTDFLPQGLAYTNKYTLSNITTLCQPMGAIWLKTLHLESALLGYSKSLCHLLSRGTNCIPSKNDTVLYILCPKVSSKYLRAVA